MKVRLAKNKKEIRKAQRLRYNVFFKEGNAKAGALQRMFRLDYDEYDQYCDHLIVLDGKKVVGTYRLMTKRNAREGIGFYSESEFILSDIVKSFNLVEAGRACVHKNYRNGRVIALLWKGILKYLEDKQADSIIGCVSFNLKDENVFDTIISSIGDKVVHNIGKPVDMSLGVDFDEKKFNSKSGEIPPLVKAYKKLGAWFSNYAVKDTKFGTIDVLVLLSTKEMNSKHIKKFSK